MKNKKIIWINVFMLINIIITGCAKNLDTRVDTQLTNEDINTNYSTLWYFGMAAYTQMQNGFTAIDNNLFAAVTDEAEETLPSSNAELFNQGTWNAFNNPADNYANDYAGIRAANYFLENSLNYPNILLINRDTLSDNGTQYHKDLNDIMWLRAENRVLRAYYYFDLIKRYGGVPLITKTIQTNDEANIPRTSYDSIVNFIISEINNSVDSMQVNWKTYDNSKDGRWTKGAALALKSRVLLYDASPLNNPANDVTRWQAAAKAAYDIIALGLYSLNNSYQDLFIADNTAKSSETILAIRMGQTNQLEKQNYPVGTAGGNSGVTPSENLVDAYEYTGTPNPADPYANRDPRLGYTIAVNNSSWTGRTLQIYSGGADDPVNTNASKTGYYLKKFLNDNLALSQGQTILRSWIVFRLGEIILNYAESMNEAYGPDDNHGYPYTARQAINILRARSDVAMPAVTVSGQVAMRAKIKQEREVELAFEDHRYWDLLRWKDAETVLNEPLMGMKVVKNSDNSFTYSTFTVESRIFTSPKMYLFPLPYTEVAKSNGILKQNNGW